MVIVKSEYKSDNKIIISIKQTMSIRFIGLQSYVPITPGNYSRGTTKIIQLTNLSNDNQLKSQNKNRYRDELDRQVEESKKKKQAIKRKQMEEDLKRQRDFNQSQKNQVYKQNYYYLPKSANKPQQQLSNVKSFNLPKQFKTNEQQQSNKNSFYFKNINELKNNNLDVPIFENKAELVNEQQHDNNNSQRRRKVFIQDIDRRLIDAYLAIQRSKRTSSSVAEELDRLKRRLKTEDNIHSKNNVASQQNYYCLPYNTHLFNSRNQLRRREA